MADVRRLCEVGFSPVAAKELANQIQTGGIVQQTAIADLAGGADLAATVTKVNAILAAMRAAGMLKT